MRQPWMWWRKLSRVSPDNKQEDIQISRTGKRVNMLFVTAGRRVRIAIKAVSIVVAASLLIGLTSCKPNLDSRVSVEKELSGLKNEEQNIEDDTLYSVQAINDSLTTWQKLITLLSAITIVVYLLFLLIKGMSMEKYFRQKNREEALKKIPDNKGGGKGGNSGISNNSTTNKSDYNNNMYNNIYLR